MMWLFDYDDVIDRIINNKMLLKRNEIQLFL